MGSERILLVLTIAVLATSLPGCAKTELAGYLPAKEHAAVPADAGSENLESIAAVDPTDASKSDPEPVVESPESDPLPVSAMVPVNVVSSVRALMSVPAGEARPKESVEPSVSSDVNPSSVAGPSETGSPATKSNAIELLIKDKKFQTVPRTGELRVSFDDIDLLKVLNMDPVVPNADELMPDWLKGLDGKSVRIRGFMYPTYETEGIERFVLARDNQICCFGRDPKIYDLVQVDMKTGKTTNYIPATRAFDVVGIFRIKMLAEEGKPFGLYQIEQASVIDR